MGLAILIQHSRSERLSNSPSHTASKRKNHGWGRVLLSRKDPAHNDSGPGAERPPPPPPGQAVSTTLVCFLVLTSSHRALDTSPKTQRAPCRAGGKPGPSSTAPPCLGHPLLPGRGAGGGTCGSWHNTKPFGEVYFYQSRSRSWKAPRASPSPHAAGGPAGGSREAKPTLIPQETFPEPSRPCTQQHGGASRPH